MDNENSLNNPEEIEQELSPEALELLNDLFITFQEQAPDFIRMGPLDPNHPDILAFEIEVKNIKLPTSRVFNVCLGELLSAIAGGLKSEIIDVVIYDEGLTVVFKNPELSEAGEPLTLETEPTTKPEFIPYEVQTEEARAKAEYRTKGPIKFSGHCAYCGKDYEITEIYKGDKPKPKGKAKNTFDLDYGNISCETPGCVDVNTVGIYAGKPHPVLMFCRHKSQTEAETRQWIEDNLEKNQ